MDNMEGEVGSLFPRTEGLIVPTLALTELIELYSIPGALGRNILIWIPAFPLYFLRDSSTQIFFPRVYACANRAERWVIRGSNFIQPVKVGLQTLWGTGCCHCEVHEMKNHFITFPWHALGINVDLAGGARDPVGADGGLLYDAHQHCELAEYLQFWQITSRGSIAVLPKNNLS